MLPSNDALGKVEPCESKKNHGKVRCAPKEIKDRRDAMKRRATALRIVYVSLGVLAVVSSVFVASQVNVKEEMLIIEDVKLVGSASIITAVSTGLMTAFGISQKSNNFMNAWRKLDNAIKEFELVEDTNCKEDTPVKKLVKACDDAEKLIGDVVYS